MPAVQVGATSSLRPGLLPRTPSASDTPPGAPGSRNGAIPASFSEVEYRSNSFGALKEVPQLPLSLNESQGASLRPILGFQVSPKSLYSSYRAARESSTRGVARGSSGSP